MLVMKWMRSCVDLFTFRIRNAPNKLFEALAAGRAILTGDFGEIGKIVRENQCGCILKDYMATEIASVLSKVTTETLKGQKEYSRQAAEEKYNWRNASSTLVSFCQNTLG